MDPHYEAIKSKTKYYVISDIHGDLTLFIKFLVGVYNDLSGNKYYIEDKQFQYFELSDEITNNIKSTNSVIYEYDNIFKIMNKDMQIPYVTFINSLNESLKSNNSCIVLNGDTFNNHYQLADKTQPPFDYLKINKDNNKLTFLNLSLNTNKEFITKLIEISIIYDSIRLLNDNLLFIVGNHELYLLANNSNNKYAINNCAYVEQLLKKSSNGGDPPDHSKYKTKKHKRKANSNLKKVTLAVSQSINKSTEQLTRLNEEKQLQVLNDQSKINSNEQLTNSKDIITFLDELQQFILDNGYIELITDRIHIQHAPNTNNYLGYNNCRFNTKLSSILEQFKCLNIIDILKNKVTNVDEINKLCNDSFYSLDIYGHTSNEKILRCKPKKDRPNTKFFIDRQYSIYEIIKNIELNYNDLRYDEHGKETDKNISNKIIVQIENELENKQHINVMLCGLIYYYCIKNKYILLANKNTNKIIHNISIDDCIKIYNNLLNRQYDIYYFLSSNIHFTKINLYIAQIFSLCYRFNSMCKINISQKTKDMLNKYYQLFEPIDLICLKCDITQNNITQINF